MYNPYQTTQQPQYQHQYSRQISPMIMRHNNQMMIMNNPTQMMMGNQQQNYYQNRMQTQIDVQRYENNISMRPAHIGRYYQNNGTCKTRSTNESIYNYSSHLQRRCQNVINHSMTQNNHQYDKSFQTQYMINYKKNNNITQRYSHFNLIDQNNNNNINYNNLSVNNNIQSSYQLDYLSKTYFQPLSYNDNSIYLNNQQYLFEMNQQFMGNFNQRNEQQIYYRKQSQYGIIHYQKQQQIQQNKQEQNSAIQLLITQINQTNIQILSYLDKQNILSSYQQRIKQKDHYNDLDKQSSSIQRKQLIQRVRLIQEVIQQNYKLYQIDNEQQQVHNSNQYYNNNNNPSYNHKAYQSLYGLVNKNNKHQRSNKINYNKLTLIDYLQQFNKFISINNHYLGDKNRRLIKDEDNNKILQRKINIYSGQQCLNVFVQLVVEIKQFYRLNYLLKESIVRRDYHQLSKQLHLQDKQDKTIQPIQGGNKSPLPITNILWYIQSLRLLIASYQHQLQHYINSNTIIINQQQQKQQQQINSILNNIKFLSIQTLNQLQQLLATFLQKIMIQPQINRQSNHYHNNNNNNYIEQQIQQTVWYFYYQYPVFNQQWICMLLDTLLKYQMVIGLGYQLTIQYVLLKMNGNKQGKQQRNNIQKFQQEKQLTFKKLNNNKNVKNSKKLINPQYQKNNNKNNIKKQPININVNNNKLRNNPHNNNKNTFINKQTTNNILSILSFLLFPHNNTQQSHSTNPINQLLQQPVKKIILKQIRKYQSQIEKYDNEQMNNDDIKQLLIKKFIIVNKITNIVSFFTTKLSQSKSKNQQYKQKSKLKNRHKDQTKSQTNHLNQPNYQTNLPLDLDYYYEDKTNLNDYKKTQKQMIQEDNIQNNNNRFSIELKIMQMTLFVRQMCDILMLDEIRTLQPNNIDKQKGIFNHVNLWIQKLSINSMIGMLFQKVLTRKQVMN